MMPHWFDVSPRRLCSITLCLALALPAPLLAQGEAAPEPVDPVKQGLDLVYSSNTVTEATREGVALLEQAAEAGNTEAMVQLGSLYLFGTVLPQDRKRALGYFEQAASAGDGAGLQEYGMMQMWGENGWRKAEAYLVRAGEMGEGEAWATLAEGAMYGYLGGGTASRRKFAGYAEKGRAAGVERIVVLEANRYMWGISVRASGPKAVEILETAADAGNAEAARYLIALVRDGNGLNVARNLKAAAGYLDSYAPLLGEAEIWQFALTIDAKRARDRDGWAAISDRILAQPEMMTKTLAADLYKANPNAAVYVLQRKLADEGYDLGRPSGYADKRTLRAMNRACRNLVQPALCEDNVLQPEVVSSLLIFR
ncbi:MAG: hypothetical protein R3D63_04520 [Paracoccaceae bacterium]